MIYLSPVWHPILPELRHEFGYIVSAKKGSSIMGIKAGYRWMLDNGAYTDKWTEKNWLETLRYWKTHAKTCIAAVCPDVVGDAKQTVVKFRQYENIIREHGFPVAFVTQDGLHMDMIPWDRFDCLFVGGSTEHKLYGAWDFIAEAQRRGKWVHIGRVNSAKRIEVFWSADSVDGTTLAIEPSPSKQRSLLGATRAATHKKGMVRLI